MFAIGEFSKIVGLPVKTLHFYHEKGLLIPARVESGTGYRYYDQCNVDAARVIVALRDLEFTLDDIQAIMAECEQDEDVLEHLERQKQKIAKRIKTQEQTISTIEQIIQSEREAREISLAAWSDIEEKHLAPQLVAGLRMQGRYDEMGKVFGKLGRFAGRHIAGKPMCLYYDGEYREEGADFEPCFPVRRKFKADSCSVRELPAARALCLQHHGPYDSLGRSYEKLLSAANDQELKLALPSREVFLKGPGMIFKGNPQSYISEIQLVLNE